MKKILVEAHRGYSAKYPENTLLAFEAAMDLGVDGVEFDIWLSKDNVPMVFHDGGLMRTCGVEGHVKDMTAEEARKVSAHYPKKFADQYAGHEKVHIPTLAELLELRAKKRPDLLLGVELKQTNQEYVDTIVEVLKQYDVLEYCCFFSYDAGVVKYLAEAHHVRTMGFPDFQMRNYQPDTYSYYDEFCVSVALAKSEVFPIYAAKGLPLQMYIADTAEDAAVCIEKGAGLIMANDPVPLLTVLGRL